MNWQLHYGDALSVLRAMPEASVHCVVSSPPYFGLRDYGTGSWEGGDPACEHKLRVKPRNDTTGSGVDKGRFSVSRGEQPLKAASLDPRQDMSTCRACGAVRVDKQIGLETTPEAFVRALVEVFAECRRVLRDNGVLWMNLGDSYANDGKWGGHTGGKHVKALHCSPIGRNKKYTGLKPKDLIGIPWMAAFALRTDGWFLRSDVIWHKPNPMPESIKDRPTKAHEMVFLLSKASRYWYDADAIREKYAASTLKQFEQPYDGEATKDYDANGVQNPSGVKARIVARARDKQAGHGRRHAGFNDRWDESVAEYAGKHSAADEDSAGRRMLASVKAARDAGADHDNPFGGANARSVWSIPTEPSPYEHFAVMPKALARRCIVSGCPAGGVVLDPFAGMATTGVVALEEGRSFVGIELNPKYHAAARERLAGVAPLLAQEIA